MWKSTLRLLVLLVSLASSSSACSVVIDNVDVTLDLFVGDDSNDGGNNGYVNCTGTYRCKNAVIMGCDRIHCMENEACQFANIEFIESVTCSGLHACRGANLTHVPTSIETLTTFTEPSVVCQGTGACDVTTISGPKSLGVTCYGGKACRKALITANSMHCTQGDSRNQACMGFASLITNCLVCGVRGCANHINQCRYKSTIAEQDLWHSQDKLSMPDSNCGNSLCRVQSSQPSYQRIY
jgi:hypothetical protein